MIMSLLVQIIDYQEDTRHYIRCTSSIHEVCFLKVQTHTMFFIKKIVPRKRKRD